ncbi:hypothetical protein E2C01_040213 [Portunus trituberculatus]|uniref:Uncharacterized protein n=1 Tax=Portunus trituberculatus TaxID=210409 RepID=A0A5B7FN66_PORTR|nr:hypothetical protein [Portunus trituberculatus]
MAAIHHVNNSALPPFHAILLPTPYSSKPPPPHSASPAVTFPLLRSLFSLSSSHFLLLCLSVLLPQLSLIPSQLARPFPSLPDHRLPITVQRIIPKTQLC